MREGTPPFRVAGTSAVTVTATAPGTRHGDVGSAGVGAGGGQRRVGHVGGTDYVAYDQTVTFGSGTAVGTGGSDPGDDPAASVTAGVDLTPVADTAGEDDETVRPGAGGGVAGGWGL